MSLGLFLVETLLPDAAIPSPHADDQHRGKRQQDEEPKPALCPVPIGRSHVTSSPGKPGRFSLFCGAVFEHWITRWDAEPDLLRAAPLN